MTATPSPNRRWVLNKAVLAHSPDSNKSCSARLRIAHDKISNQGSISLKITADLANLGGRSQVLTLNIPPELVQKCALARISNGDLCSSDLLHLLPASVNNVSAVSTLSLRLRTAGIVICPPEMETLSPFKPGDQNFHAFANICQSEYLRLHFARRQFVNDDFERLDAFFCALRGGVLQPEPFDYTRQGLVQKDWHIFSLPLNPPPYCEELVSEQTKRVDPPLYYEEFQYGQVIGKRRGDPSSMPSDDEPRKRLLFPSPQPPGSPTEVNTPSTLSPSPSTIRPTHFNRNSSPGCTDDKRLARLEQELRGVSDDLICRLLVRSGHQHLLAASLPVDSDQTFESEKVSSTNVKMIERRLKLYIDETIERRLKPHVDGIVDTAVSECRDQIFDEFKTNEAELREQVDDGNVEIRTTTNDCLKDIEQEAQRYMYEMEDRAQQCMNDIEDRGIEVEMFAEEKAAVLKRRFNASVSPSHELGVNARRSSM